MEKIHSNFLNQLSLFKVHHGGLKDIVDNDNPEHPMVVIDQLPNRNRATYCIHTKEGWIVFSKEYNSDNIVFPAIYGILFKKLDIDRFSEASLHGMSVDDLYSLCESINGTDHNTSIGLGNSSD